MSYTAPYIDESGLHLPSYLDARDELVSRMRSIFGEDIYLAADSMDYQMLCVFAEKLGDVYSAIQLTYNNRSPATATGAGLFSLGRLNGIRRKSASHSTATLRISGTPGTVITGGLAATADGQLWKLNDSVTISEDGTVDALATCQESGRIFADADTINRIMTPRLGWTAVTNPNAAEPGNDIESAASFRARQMLSVAPASRTVLYGTYGAIMAVDNVTRAKLYENKSDVTDDNGIPAHSICAVVEGGDSEEIGKAIYYHKTPGCGTYGDVEVSVTEEMESGAVDVPPISFYRPSYVDALVKITVKALSGYTEQTTLDIIANTEAYLSELEIGSDLVLSALYSPILAATADIRDPSFSVVSVQIGRDVDALSAADIEVAFHEVTRGVAGHITVEVV